MPRKKAKHSIPTRRLQCQIPADVYRSVQVASKLDRRTMKDFVVIALERLSQKIRDEHPKQYEEYDQLFADTEEDHSHDAIATTRSTTH